ncbi:MAG: hypothetical protein IPK97_21335 [Ahniella sp.]|nr:hypothetical protein [Ahniella sp.]
MIRERDKSQQVTGFLLRLFEQADPADESRPSSRCGDHGGNGLRDVSANIELKPEVKAEMLATLSTVLVGSGEYAEALSAAQQAEQQTAELSPIEPILGEQGQDRTRPCEHRKRPRRFGAK